MKKNFASSIRVLYHICCGIDIHKRFLTACILKTDVKSGDEEIDVREFTTFTDDLIELREWLLSNGCEAVAIESTGVYWRPVHNVLEDYLKVILVNSRYHRNLPGKKTDVNDSIWLAELLRGGLLKGSFIPPKHVREWRDLTRLRRKNVDTLSDYKRRVHKLFETANIKIDNVISDICCFILQQARVFKDKKK